MSFWQVEAKSDIGGIQMFGVEADDENQANIKAAERLQHYKFSWDLTVNLIPNREARSNGRRKKTQQGSETPARDPNTGT